MASFRHEWVIDRKVDRISPAPMPHGLKRFQQTGNLHSLTFSCYHRLPFLAPECANRCSNKSLEQTREPHTIKIPGYIPEHATSRCPKPPTRISHHPQDST